jgi:hypothetical protein
MAAHAEALHQAMMVRPSNRIAGTAVSRVFRSLGESRDSASRSIFSTHAAPHQLRAQSYS